MSGGIGTFSNFNISCNFFTHVNNGSSYPSNMISRTLLRTNDDSLILERNKLTNGRSLKKNNHLDNKICKHVFGAYITISSVTNQIRN